MNAVVERKPEHELAPTNQPQLQPRPLSVVEYAIQKGATVEEVRALVEMQVQMDQHKMAMAERQDVRDREARLEAARNAFNEALVAFQAEPPVILKEKHVEFQSRGGTTSYNHATHNAVVQALAKALSAHGLSFSWAPVQGGGKITVTCTLRHKLGHSESVSLTGEYDESGGKNSIQAVISAKSYLERHTLLAITGSSTADMTDDDGRGAGKGTGKPTPEEVEAKLQALLAAVEAATTDKACVVIWDANKPKKAGLGLMGDESANAEFRAAVVARRTALKGQQ